MDETVTMLKELHALRSLKTNALRAKYAEVFGEGTASRNRDYLLRRIANELRARADAQAASAKREPQPTAKRANRRTVASPATAAAAENPAAGAARAAPSTVPAKPAASEQPRRAPAGRDPRVPPAGTVLRREFGGRVHEVTVLEDGFEYNGEHWRSLSGIAKRIAGGTSWNGLLFFHLIPYARRGRPAA